MFQQGQVASHVPAGEVPTVHDNRWEDAGDGGTGQNAGAEWASGENDRLARDRVGGQQVRRDRRS